MPAQGEWDPRRGLHRTPAELGEPPPHAGSPRLAETPPGSYRAPAAGSHCGSESSQAPQRVRPAPRPKRRSPTRQPLQRERRASGFPGDRRPAHGGLLQSRAWPCPDTPHGVQGWGQGAPLYDLTGPSALSPFGATQRPRTSASAGLLSEPPRTRGPGTSVSTRDTDLDVQQRMVGQPLGQGLPGGERAKCSQRPREHSTGNVPE